MSENLAMYRLAQRITDEAMGKGTYANLNKFDPSKGETRQGQKRAEQQKPERSSKKPTKKKRS